MSKKILATLLAFCLVLSLLPVGALAEDSDPGAECTDTTSCNHLAEYGGKHFNTLQGAVNASEADTATTGEYTVKILKDITDLSSPVLIKKSISINLNDKRVAASGATVYAFKVGAGNDCSDKVENVNLTVTSGTESKGTIGAADATNLASACRGIRFNSTGTMTITNVIVNVSQFGIVNRAGGTANVNNCTVASDAGPAVSSMDENSPEDGGGGTMTITGGKYSASTGTTDDAKAESVVRTAGKTAKLTINGGEFTSTNETDSANVICCGFGEVKKNNLMDGGTLEFGENGAKIKSEHTYGIGAFNGAKVTIGKEVEITSYFSALGGNNLLQTENFTVNEGAILTSTHAPAIFFPSAGELTINGGKITGLTGINALLGDVTINGGEIIATAPTADYTDSKLDASYLGGSGSGPRWNGSALLMVTKRYKSEVTGATFNLNISDGKFTANGDGKAVDVQQATTPVDDTPDFSAAITGGTFSTDPSEYVDLTTHKVTEETKDDGVTIYTVTSASSGGNPGGDNPGGGSSSGGGGGSTSTPSTPTTTTEANPTVTNGTASTTVSSSTADTLVEGAKADNAEEVTVKVEPTGGTADTVEVSLPASAVSDLGSQTNAALTVETPVADVKIPNESLGELSQGAGNVTVSAAKNEDASVSITVKKDSNVVTNLSQPMKAVIPAENVTSGTVAVRVNPDGTETIIKKSIAGSGELNVLLNGSATVKIKDNSKSFDDTKDHWADKDGSIAFVSSHELFMGTTKTSFAPEQTMTRAMLVTVLHRLEDTPKGTAPAFGDVKGTEYYAEAVAWGSQQGIVVGDGTNFMPDKNVTREQLATFLYRYATTYGINTTGRTSLTGFSDSAKVSGYAKEAMEWCVNVGLIKGVGKNSLNPAGSAKRGEVAAILMRFVNYINK